jgi:glycerophosphoryl diester phosphodiesterase
MILDSSNPLVIAHRGASAHAPENTLSAFKLALEQGAKAIELDVQLTADQEVVVFHDPTIQRISKFQGKISDYKLEDLKKLNAGFAYGPAFQGEKIPTLTEVFENLDGVSLFIIELKNLTSPFDNLARKVSGLIDEYNKTDKVLISSFSLISLSKFNYFNSAVPLGRLFRSPLLLNTYQLLIPISSHYRSVHLPHKALNESRVKYLHSHNKLVFVYTLNHPRDMLEAIKLGVDGFFTDDPALALRTLEQL